MADRKIGIIGYGEAGKQIEYLLREDNDQEFCFHYFDDFLYDRGLENAFLFSDFDSNKFGDLEFYIGLGYHHLALKKEIGNQILKNGFSLPTLIHKTAFVHPSAKIGSGVVLYPMSNIGFNVVISDGVHLNNSVIVSHDSFVGNSTFMSPGVIISGFVDVGSECFFGSGTMVANGLKIGKGVKTGVGTVITKDVADDEMVIGNPLKTINKLSIR